MLLYKKLLLMTFGTTLVLHVKMIHKKYEKNNGQEYNKTWN